MKSFYNSLRNQSFCFPFRFIWGVRLPLKVKIFLWLVLKGKILTKDNLLRRGWSGDEACVFCGMDENINHLFLVCSLSKFIWNIVGCAFNLPCPPVDIQQLMNNWMGCSDKRIRRLVIVGVVAIVWSVWRVRNTACFHLKWPLELVSVMYDVCRCIGLWSKLQKEADQEALVRGAKTFERVAMEVFGARRR